MSVGLAVGLAALTKHEGGLLATVYAGSVAIVLRRQSEAWPRQPWLRGALGVFVVLLLVLAVLIPYRFYFRIETGRWKPASKSLYTLIVAERFRSMSRREAFFGLNKTRTDTELADRLGQETLSESLIRDWPWLVPTVAHNAPQNLKRVFTPLHEWVGAALLIVGAAAAVRGWRRKRSGTILIPAAASPAAVQISAYSVLVPHSRQIMTLVPSLAVFAAASLRQFFERCHIQIVSLRCASSWS